jgi:hypothetical protein
VHLNAFSTLFERIDPNQVKRGSPTNGKDRDIAVVMLKLIEFKSRFAD